MYHIYDCVLFSVYLEILSRMIKALDLNTAIECRVFVHKSFSFLYLLCRLLFLLRFSLSLFFSFM